MSRMLENKQSQNTGLNLPLWEHKSDGSYCWESICSGKNVDASIALYFFLRFPVNGKI